MNLFSYIKQRVPILDVVSEYATLKKAGLYWKGCCPFHHERTPSFSVSPHKEIFYCFGCHAGGDVISFIAKVEHCSPIEAARHLVDRYRIQLPQEVTWEKGSDTQEERNSYYQTCAVFAKWCAEQLTKNIPAQEYLTQRSITPESVKEFGIGLCPREIKSLLALGQKENVLAQNFIDAHILQEGRTGLYTPFEDRIIFPIRDHIGRYVGFGGRIYKDNDDRVKYYNSHDHAFFNKSSILFGLDRAKKAISQKETVFLVEGYTDLIIMHQFGYTNTVATMGTACTQEHLKLVSRYAQFLYIMYDGDAAGQNAVMRLVELCWQVALDPYVLTLPSADDPATFLLAGGDMEEKIRSAHDIFSFVVHQQSEDFSHKSLQERLAVVKKVIALINHIPDALKRDLLLQQASDTFALPLATLTKAANVASQTSRLQLTPAQPEISAEQEYSKIIDETSTLLNISQLEKKLFSAILSSKVELSQEDKTLLRLWISEALKNLFDSIMNSKTAEGTDTRVLFEQLAEDEKAFVSQCLALGISNQQGIAELDEQETVTPSSLAEILTHFYKKQWKLAVHNVKLSIYEAQQKGDEERVKQLLNDFDGLKKKMLSRGVS